MISIVYLRYSDLFDEKPTLAALKKKLRQFKLSSVVLDLSRINVLLGREVMLGRGRKSMQDLQGLLVENYIDDEILEGRLKPRFGSQMRDESPIFNRQQALTLIRLCALVCSEDAPLLAHGKTPEGYELGRCALMMNDHLVSAKEERSINEGTGLKRRKHLGLQLAPLLEFYNPPRINYAAVRAEAIFSEVLNSPEMQALVPRELKGLDIAKVFRDFTGLTIDQYKELNLGIISWLFGSDAQQVLKDSGSFIFRRERFINDTLIKPEDFARYLALDSVKLSELKDIFETNKTETDKTKLLPQWDHVILRNRPLLQVEEDSFACVDPCFTVEKLSAGIYWSIIDGLKGSDVGNLAFNAFGYLFEIYVNRILQQISPLDGPFIASPKYDNGDNAVDGIICRGNHLILMEYKASFIRVEAKYSGKIRTLEAELDKKFGAKKGVVQLVNHIGRMFPRKMKGDADHEFARRAKRGRIDELDRVLQNSHARVEKITPVLVVWDSYLRFPAIVELLNRRLKSLLKRKKVKNSIQVAPLAVIDIDTLERMRPNLIAGDFTLEQCLNARALRDPEYKHVLNNFLSEHFPQYGQREDPELESKFEMIMSRVKRNFFGGED